MPPSRIEPDGLSVPSSPDVGNLENGFCAGINPKKICCIGAGYVGGPTMAMIAKFCPDIEVWVTDISEPRINAWKTDNLPIYEPGLLEIVQECRGRNLFFSTDCEAKVQECDIIFVSVNTPTKSAGIGAGQAANLMYWEKVGRMIGRVSTRNKIVVEKSTVPVRTAAALHRVLTAGPGNAKFVILSNPEFLAEGTAIKDLTNPDRILIGGPQHAVGIQCIETLVKVYANWVPREKIITTNLWSSELSKLVANAFLAQRVSSINAISQLCVKTGADVDEVAHAVGFDSRIGSKFLKASIGFGGSCFQKDILNLVYLCEQFGLQPVADYWRTVVDMNECQKRQFTTNIIEELFNTVDDKKIAIFGFAFKKDTGDVRETPAVTVCDLLLADGANLQVWDPKVKEHDAIHELKIHKVPVEEAQKKGKLTFCSSVEQAVVDAHAIVILTEWDEFKTYDYGRFLMKMQQPAFIFDGRNILSDQAQNLADMGYIVHGVGKRVLKRVGPQKPGAEPGDFSPRTPLGLGDITAGF